MKNSCILSRIYFVQSEPFCLFDDCLRLIILFRQQTRTKYSLDWCCKIASVTAEQEFWTTLELLRTLCLTLTAIKVHYICASEVSYTCEVRLKSSFSIFLCTEFTYCFLCTEWLLTAVCVQSAVCKFLEQFWVRIGTVTHEVHYVTWISWSVIFSCTGW